MVEEENSKFYQVEYNLIAAGMGPICEQTKKVHNIINGMTGKPSSDIKDLENTQTFTDAFIEAHKLYGNPEAIIVKINQNEDANKFDQLFPIEGLSDHGIVYDTYTFQELIDLGTFDEETGKFTV